MDPSEDCPNPAASRALNEVNFMSVFCQGHPLASIRQDLSDTGIIMAKDLRRTPSGCMVKVCGILVIMHTPPTKSGKRIMFITIEDESGLIDLVVFPKTQKTCANKILTSTVIAVEGKLQRQGNGLSISIIVQRLLKNWTGSLAELLSQKSKK